MKVRQICFVVFTLLLFVRFAPSQVENWNKLVALESTRSEVEKIVGKPEVYFETYGTYETEIGKFHVWYSKGRCQKDVEGLQWDIPAQRLARIDFYPKKSLPLKNYISNKKVFTKTNHPTLGFRFFYTSPDETIIYQTILPKASPEFVYTIELHPGKDKQNWLCNNKKIVAAQDWYKGIIPMKSTCKDVKNILSGKCGKSEDRFSLPEETVVISYSTEKCQTAFEKKWNVPIGTVLSITRFFRNPSTLKELGMEIVESEFNKSYTDVRGQIIYEKKKGGLNLAISNGYVNYLNYTPTSEDNSKICKSNK